MTYKLLSLLSVLLVSLLVSTADAFVARGPRGVVTSRRQSTLLPATAKKVAAKKTAKKKKASPKKAAPEVLKKAEFVAAVSEKTGMTKKGTEAALSAILETVQQYVGAGQKVALPGFGSFVLRERSARKGRNPQTGEEMQISASKSPGFTASKTWKDALNGK